MLARRALALLPGAAAINIPGKCIAGYYLIGVRTPTATIKRKRGRHPARTVGRIGDRESARAKAEQPTTRQERGRRPDGSLRRWQESATLQRLSFVRPAIKIFL